MARAVVDERTRVPFFLIADEIQNFATDSFSEIASEARKMKLGMVLGHQFLEQLPRKLRAAILGNVGSIASAQHGYSKPPKALPAFHDEMRRTEKKILDLKRDGEEARGLFAALPAELAKIQKA